MFQRLFVASVSSVVLFVGICGAGDRFPSTAEDHATLYEINLYRAFRDDSAEYRRRLKTARHVLAEYKNSSNASADEAVAIEWFTRASQSNALPETPVFSEDADAEARPVRTVVEERSGNTPASESRLQADLEDGSEPDQKRLPQWKPSGNPTPNEKLDRNRFPGGQEVASDLQERPSSSGAGGTTRQSVANKLRNSIESLVDSQVAKVEGIERSGSGGNSSGSTGRDVGPALDALAAAADSSSLVEKLPVLDNGGALSEDGEATFKLSLNGNGKNVSLADFSSLSGIGSVEDALPPIGTTQIAMAGLLIFGMFSSVVCALRQLFVAFKNNFLLGLVSLIFFGLAGFIIGWMKHREWNLTKTMKIWSLCAIATTAMSLAMPFIGNLP